MFVEESIEEKERRINKEVFGVLAIFNIERRKERKKEFVGMK